MSIDSPAQPRSRQFKLLRAVAIGLAISFAAPAFADDELPEVQRLIRQGQYPQALEKVDAYLGSRPKDAQGRFLKGLIYTEMNRPTEAIGVFTRLSEDYPELPEPYNNLAVLYAQQRLYDKAREALLMAIRTHPSYAIAHENLGDVYAKMASQAYDRALQLDGSNTGTQNKLALIRDLISASGKSNIKPTATATPAAAVTPPPEPVKPAAQVAPATQPAPVAVQAPVVKVADAKPMPKPKPTPKVEAASDDIASAINAWASAWERKDMKAYFSAYAADFRTSTGVSRKDWEAERSKRIAGKGGKISVKIEDLQTTINGDSATVKFRQHYKAPGMNSTASKTMTLVRSANRWLIQEEKAR